MIRRSFLKVLSGLLAWLWLPWRRKTEAVTPAALDWQDAVAAGDYCHADQGVVVVKPGEPGLLFVHLNLKVGPPRVVDGRDRGREVRGDIGTLLGPRPIMTDFYLTFGDVRRHAGNHLYFGVGSDVESRRWCKISQVLISSVAANFAADEMMVGDRISFVANDFDVVTDPLLKGGR